MKMNGLKAKIRKCEQEMLWAGMLLTAVVLLIRSGSGISFYAVIIGHFLGLASFAMLAESYSVFDRLPRWTIAAGLFFSNIKLLLIAVLVYLLHLLDYSVPQIILGIIISQLSLLFSFFCTLNADNKNAEVKKNT
jgi:hypothetical protein